MVTFFAHIRSYADRERNAWNNIQLLLKGPCPQQYNFMFLLDFIVVQNGLSIVFYSTFYRLVETIISSTLLIANKSRIKHFTFILLFPAMKSYDITRKTLNIPHSSDSFIKYKFRVKFAKTFGTSTSS